MDVSGIKALVEPRVCSPETGDVLPLVDVVSAYLYSDIQTIQLVGEGSSVGLAHLAQHFESAPRVRFVEYKVNSETLANEGGLTIFISNFGQVADLKLRLEPWGRDQVIEYLIAKAPYRCNSVMNRILESDQLWMLDGSPQVTSMVLDEMIVDDQVDSIQKGIEASFDGFLPEDETGRNRIEAGLMGFLQDDPLSAEIFWKNNEGHLSKSQLRFLMRLPVRQVITSRIFADLIWKERSFPELGKIWPKEIVELVSERLKLAMVNSQVPELEKCFRHLQNLVSKNLEGVAANTASLLIRLNPTWRPKRRSKGNWAGANFANAKWKGLVARQSNLSRCDLTCSELPGVNLAGSVCMHADFSHSDLGGSHLNKLSAKYGVFVGANLKNASCRESKFQLARFQTACMSHCDFYASHFEGANFRNADASYSDFSKSKFRNSDFENADLSFAKFESADLAGANLTKTILEGSVFSNADLVSSSFAGVSLVGNNLHLANLIGANLTGTRFKDCWLGGVDLTAAYLGQIRWEGCDLRGAKLIGCQFHYGNSRSGLVGSIYPSHGTRTGFYTDDFDDRYFKSPEAIRKGSLQGCDLRGADVFQSDFYLIDLRGAQYDELQKKHFQSCGAILDD